MERVVIIGAGGHAREVLQILRTCQAQGQPIEPVGFVVDVFEEADQSARDIPVLGDFRWFDTMERGDLGVIAAVGTPRLSRHLVERARALGLRFATAISPNAWLASSASIAEGAMVFPSVVVNADASIEEHVTLNVSSTVSHDTRVGRHSSVGPGAHLAGNVVIEEGCFIGMGANIVQGVRVGEASVVGAGAVVIEDVPAGVTVVGVPGRIIGPASPDPMNADRAKLDARVGRAG